MSTATELLRRMIGYLDYSNKEADAFAVEVEAFLDEAFLAAEPEAEPVAFGFDRYVDGKLMAQGVKIENATDLQDAIRLALRFCPRSIGTTVLILNNHSPRPEPARKPISVEEIKEQALEMQELGMEVKTKSFVAGVRFAEKHHGIGGDDE